MKDKIAFTKDLVLKAGDNLQKLMEEKIEIETKTSDTDFVTNVDKQTEIFLVEGIQSQYEKQDFLTEEDTTDRHKSDDLWIIDPIDGTTNFIYQHQNFAISVAYYYKRKPVFGIVYDVMAKKLYMGIKGEGAYLNDEKLEISQPDKSLKNSIVYADLSSLKFLTKGIEHFQNSFVSHRYLGAASLEICYLAANMGQVYITRQLKAWDVAAAAIVLNEAGGTFFFGGHENEIFFNNKNGFFVGAQNQKLKKEVLNLLDSKGIQKIL